MANVPELFDIAEQIQEDERRASIDQPGSSRPSNVAAQPQQTLGEEVNEVIGQLGRFWGGFSKQVRRLELISPVHLSAWPESSRSPNREEGLSLSSGNCA